MSDTRERASRQEVDEAVREIRAFHEQGRQSLRELRERGGYGDKAIDEQAERLGWNPTKLRKARQFARSGDGYSHAQLNELCRLVREHQPVFGPSHVMLLLTVTWEQGRGELQRLCIEGNWSKSELEAEVKRRFGTRRWGGRRRRVSNDPDRVLVQLEVMADTWQRWFAVASETGEGGNEEESLLARLPEQVRECVGVVNRAVKSLRRVVTGELEQVRVEERAGNPN